jgi:hypothetical protein
MTPIQLLALLLAISATLNIASAAGLLARHAGVCTTHAIFIGASSAATTLGLYFAAIASCH